jgi:hypothetical protein
MPVESFVDLVTYTFQATVFPTLTIGLGYLIAAKSNNNNLPKVNRYSPDLEKLENYKLTRLVGGRCATQTLPWLARTLLAPCLVISTLAPAENINFKTFWKCGSRAYYPDQTAIEG